MPNILPETKVRGSLLVDIPRAEHIHGFYYGSYNKYHDDDIIIV